VSDYFRPVVQTDIIRPKAAVDLTGGPLWFDQVEHMARGQVGQVIPASEIPKAVLDRLTRPRKDICGISMQNPSIMGILNVTPDSFSDGGLHIDPALAAQKMQQQGADIIDIGGESTRPNADYVGAETEIERTVPVIKQLSGVLSIDTRKAAVADAAINAGAMMFNDVTALSFDPDSLKTALTADAVCLMHSVGTPKTMQDNPNYNNVLLDVYDYLETRIQACETAGIARHKIMVDPGIGFGKTVEHNLALIRGISLFHGLGCTIMLGVSRKNTINQIANVPDPKQRFAGSIALAIQGLNQGVQMLRVHDIAATKQAIDLWRAGTGQ